MTQLSIGSHILDQDPQDMLRWHTRCGRVTLWLDMKRDVKFPWRTAIDGMPLRSKWSTPYVAIMRTMGKMERGNYEPGKVADISVSRDSHGR